MDTHTPADFLKPRDAGVLVSPVLRHSPVRVGLGDRRRRRCVRRWSALQLLQRGAKVTLLDAWGRENSRASSGGETRTIRATYGLRTLYTRGWSPGSPAVAREREAMEVKLFFHSGALRMAGADDSYERAALPVLEQAVFVLKNSQRPECTRRWPQNQF